jgi:hypothetical protein
MRDLCRDGDVIAAASAAIRVERPGAAKDGKRLAQVAPALRPVVGKSATGVLLAELIGLLAQAALKHIHASLKLLCARH